MPYTRWASLMRDRRHSHSPPPFRRPIAYRLGEVTVDLGDYLLNIGHGGLCFVSPIPSGCTSLLTAASIGLCARLQHRVFSGGPLRQPLSRGRGGFLTS